MEEYELIIIGAGPAGLSAAIEAKASGLRRIAIAERLPKPGGILTQCLHRGFDGEKTGPEFAQQLLCRIDKHAVQILTEAYALSIDASGTVRLLSSDGVSEHRPRAVILATGCRERSIGALPVTGTRPAGVFTAGSAQRMINLGGYRFGKRAVVLGAGDVGMIAAHHLTETGTEVVAIIERQDKIGGLMRNKTRYLDPHGIPVIYKSTITQLHGIERLTGVSVCGVSDTGEPIYETERQIDCDTLITSVGLIPELELLRDLGLSFSGDALAEPELPKTALPWLFVCGNAGRVHRMVEAVTAEGRAAGELAAAYIKSL